MHAAFYPVNTSNPILLYCTVQVLVLRNPAHSPIFAAIHRAQHKQTLMFFMSHQEAQQHVEQQQQGERVGELNWHPRGVQQDAPEALIEADKGHQEGDAQVATGVPHLAGKQVKPEVGGGGERGRGRGFFRCCSSPLTCMSPCRDEPTAAVGNWGAYSCTCCLPSSCMHAYLSRRAEHHRWERSGGGGYSLLLLAFHMYRYISGRTGTSVRNWGGGGGATHFHA